MTSASAAAVESESGGRRGARRRGLFGSNPAPLRSDPTLRDRHWTSRLLHTAGAATAHSGAGLLALVALGSWMVVGIVDGFSHGWEVVLYSTTASVTFLMVFVIQHTQARQTSATQRKLDELIRSSSDADSTFIAIEGAPDDRLEQLTRISDADRSKAQDEQRRNRQPGP